MTREELNTFKLPDSPGIYYYRGTRGKILYIGKATSLRDRVRSYFLSNLTDARNSAIAAMVEEATSITWQTTDSVLEALILEANEIKKHQPKYNSREKDDKSFNYLVITKEAYPRVFVARGREIFGLFLKTKNLKLKTIFGPYPHGYSLQIALKIVRKIFPFRDKCVPCNNQLKTKNSKLKPNSCKPCFNRQIGLCPGVCSGEISKSEYAKTVRHIKQIFSGKMPSLKRQLEREMKAEAKQEHFEKAAVIRRQINSLNHIRDVSLIKNGDMLPNESKMMRIEAYDVAHMSGTETVAAMTVINNGQPEKSSYRKFKIQTAANDDIAALKEALSRRLTHAEWPLPRVFVVDGGRAQLKAAENTLKNAGIMIPVVAVTKNEFHKPERLMGDVHAIQILGKDILLANQEAHRFAITYHRKRLRVRDKFL